ncbi:MAG TPA: ABC transporter ATP-binding protein [Gaiellaceae bacterium]|nr:ABC transporter ATP-binding protein [Gaiellaceae bacterium]
MTESAIVVSALRIARGGRPVLRDIDCTVESGAVTGLLGPSGCGKSTLLRAIVGVQLVSGGSIRVFGLQAGAPELRTRLAYMTQAPSVYGDLTVLENLRYFARIVDRPERVAEVVELVGLGTHTNDLVRDLSGGERSRTSLAVALLGEPDLLVLDEPTVGLDPLLRRELWATFHRLAEAGTTLLVSTHVMDEAERCDRLLLMREGRILAAGTPEELRGRTDASTIEGAFLYLTGER